MRNAVSQRRAAGALATIAMSAFLTGCSWLGIGGDDNEKKVPKDAKCPAVRVLPQLSSLHRFTGPTTSFTDLAYMAHLTDAKSECDLEVDKATVSLTFSLVAERGPRSSGEAQFPYFVAVVNPDGKIISKRIVNASFSFPQGQSSEGSTRSETEIVTYDDPKDAEDYAILVGLQLTPAERDYNLKTPTSGN